MRHFSESNDGPACGCGFRSQYTQVSQTLSTVVLPIHRSCNVLRWRHDLNRRGGSGRPLGDSASGDDTVFQCFVLDGITSALRSLQ